MTYRFGDIVVNHSAGDGNPHKQGIVVRVRHRSGRLNPGRYVECTDGKGAFWQYGGPNEKLEVIGCALKDLPLRRSDNSNEVKS
jgi:hypothetical protein